MDKNDLILKFNIDYFNNGIKYIGGFSFKFINIDNLKVILIIGDIKYLLITVKYNI